MRQPNRRRPALLHALLLAASLCALLMAPRVHAAPVAPQGTPVVVPTPAELAPAKPALTDKAALPDRPVVDRELGKPEDELKIDVLAYVVSDQAPAALRAALPALTAPFVGRGKGFEDLVNAANEVTRFLQRDLGYYLGYAYIPEQTMDGQRVRIAVLEGRLDRVVLNWDDKLPVRREVVQGYLDRLQPGAILTVRDVERTVFLINDLRGITVKAEVKTGSTPGTATLVFTPTADAKFSGSAEADLNGARFIGSQRVGAQVIWASPFGRGDGISGSLLTSTTGGLRFALVGYTTPLGGDGIKAGASVSAVQYKLDETEFPLGLNGSGTTLNVFALYPWVRSRNLNLFALGAVNAKRYTDNVVALATRKAVDDLSLGVGGDFRDDLLTGGVNTFEVSLGSGRLSFADGAVAGSDDARQFTKVNFAYSRLQNVVNRQLMAYLTLRGQFALQNLDSTEQFRAGGTNGLRAFSPGEGTGDSGLVASLELRWLPPQSLLGKYAREIVFSAFFDGAYVQLRKNPDLVVRDTTYVNHTALGGAGVSMVWARPGVFSARLSVASPTRGKPVTDTRERSPRLYAQGSWLF